MRRVLVTGGYNIGRAGVATIVYRWGQAFDSSKVIYDYLMVKGFPEEWYVSSIKKKGGKILTPEKKISGIRKMLWIIKAMRGYEIIHINIDVAYKAVAYIIMAKVAGIKKIAMHSHCASVDDSNYVTRRMKIILHYILRPMATKMSNVRLACSERAAIWMFGKKTVKKNRYISIFNGLDVETYRYDITARLECRREIGISPDVPIIGNVGRLSYQKNHTYLINVFCQFKEKHPEAKMILVGDGELTDVLKAYARDKGVSDDVLFLGKRRDVEKLLSAMDVFVMTSFFEGLPLVLVEAQMTNLPCVVSDVVSKESKILDECVFVNLGNTEKWVQEIEKLLNKNRMEITIHDKNNYSIAISAEKLQGVLLEM